MVDPERARSSSLHGAGLRFGRVAGAPLVPILLARNLTDRAVMISGRIPYVTADGEEGAVQLPRMRLACREVREIDLAAVLRQRGLGRILSAGLELEHDGAPGSVIAKALSMGAGGTLVFRVPLVDAALASGTGIYPWSLADGRTAIVYIKNATAEPRDYTLTLAFPGGSYVLGLKTLGPRQTMALNLRNLRDRQIPDVYGHVIPPQVSAGKAHWSMKGAQQHVLVGRLEVVDFARGWSMTASCGACCPNSLYDAFMSPGSLTGYSDGGWTFHVYLAETNCFGSTLPWYPLSFSYFSSTDSTVATVNNSGQVQGVGPGFASIESTVYGEVYDNCAAEAANEEYCCDQTVIVIPTETSVEMLPRVAIEVNHTSSQNDDVVQVQSTIPARRNKVMARARALDNPSQDLSVVITNPDGRLRFPDSGDTTKSLSLPENGAWVDFEISGEIASDSKDDALIEAHCGSASEVVCGRENATVFTFDSASIKVTALGTYQLTDGFGGKYQPGNDPTVKYEAQATIKPSGLDCSVAPLKDLRVGILQNIEGSAHYYRLSDPEVQFAGGAPSGARVTVPDVIELRVTLPDKYNDSNPAVAPLYDRPGAGTTTIDANSQVLPGGCGQSTPPKATSRDSPGFENKLRTRALEDTTGAEVGQTIYHRIEQVSILDSFRVWVAVWDMTPSGVTLLRETTWSVDADSSRTAVQKGTSAGSDSAAAISPVIDPPYAKESTTLAFLRSGTPRVFVKP
jgi:hypothetical protein